MFKQIKNITSSCHAYVFFLNKSGSNFKFCFNFMKMEYMFGIDVCMQCLNLLQIIICNRLLFYRFPATFAALEIRYLGMA